MVGSVRNLIVLIEAGVRDGKTFVKCPKSKVVENVLYLLWDQGFIRGFESTDKYLTIYIKYIDGCSVIRNIKFFGGKGFITPLHSIVHRGGSKGSDFLGGIYVISEATGLHIYSASISVRRLFCSWVLYIC